MKISEQIKLTCEDIGISIRELDKKAFGGRQLLQSRIHHGGDFSKKEIKTVKNIIGDFENNLHIVFTHRKILAMLDRRKLKNYRNISGISLGDMGSFIGVGRSTYMAYETGTRKVTWPMLCKICDVLYIDPVDLTKEGYERTPAKQQHKTKTTFMIWRKNPDGSYGDCQYVKKEA
jgi:DNA-binding XRE family transcriptional regulator